jgi:hypothetical protein
MPLKLEDHEALSLRLGGFALQVEGRAPHTSDDTWDATWLAAAATCDAQGSRVSIPGILLTSWSVRRFREGLVELARSHTGCALLAAEGPELSLCVRPGTTPGRMSARVDITPRHESQGHWFAFEVDDAYLATLIGQCGAILDAFPTHEMADAYDAPGHSAP